MNVTYIRSLKRNKIKPRIISPSIVKSNVLHLHKNMTEISNAGADWFHFSVQDGKMVPKISIGSPIISAARNEFKNTIFDVKLSVIEPENRLHEFAEAGADIISVHPESTLQLAAVLSKINDLGCASGVVLNPGTSVASIEYLLEYIDVVVIMLVNPGHGGKKYINEAISKIQIIESICASRNISTPHIEVDGGVSLMNSAQLLAAGANILVVGTALFQAKYKRKMIKDILLLD